MRLEQDESEMDMNFNWTVFESPLLTENVEPETTDLTARAPKPLSQPNEPSEQQRQVYNLTHLPFRFWYPHCVRGTAKEQQSVKSTDRQPVIQVDYCFVTTGKDSHGTECPQVTVLTATNVQTGLGMSAVVPQKGRQKYCVAELKRFVFETGRSFGILQNDLEPSLKALVQDTVSELGGLSLRATPKDWKQAHGSIGKAQQNLYRQIRTLRLQLQERYALEITAQDCIYPWIVKHGQFLLNRYLIHANGLTSFRRRWDEDYTSGLCEFGEWTV